MFLRITVGAVLLGVFGQAWGADKPRLTLHVYEEEDAVPNAPSKSDAIDGALAELMDKDERVKWSKFYDLLEPPDVAARALGEADLALHDAEESFGQMDLDKTKELLKSAILAYQQYLPQLAVRGGGITPLRDAW